ncbi:hypothetical protein Ccrd_019563 [Cynara cardunculus var. scolymus]|uniref:Uncharacterized protein n=1 Tax=Cynara cardunculus var. scolymus TaxID=59895 RepID=A0A103Y429_CYNCS|nr:hypothetical protein Ccrd_019563 [Cynara cardunculus var. scolymus]
MIKRKRIESIRIEQRTMNVSNVDVFDEFVNVVLHHQVAYCISCISRVNKNKFPLPNNDISLLMGSCSLAMASDSSPLQDFYVAAPKRRGSITIVNAVFDSNPVIVRDLLAKAFQMDKNVVYQIQSKF